VTAEQGICSGSSHNRGEIPKVMVVSTVKTVSLGMFFTRLSSRDFRYDIKNPDIVRVLHVVMGVPVMHLLPIHKSSSKCGSIVGSKVLHIR
jgi:hypothetical protein